MTEKTNIGGQFFFLNLTAIHKKSPRSIRIRALGFVDQSLINCTT